MIEILGKLSCGCWLNTVEEV